ncbi:MAG: sigma-70 family RNA polymerase sigma factor [Polyangia bacterium]
MTQNLKAGKRDRNLDLYFDELGRSAPRHSAGKNEPLEAIRRLELATWRAVLEARDGPGASGAVLAVLEDWAAGVPKRAAAVERLAELGAGDLFLEDGSGSEALEEATRAMLEADPDRELLATLVRLHEDDEEIESLWEEISRRKAAFIRSNLRLVIAVAKKYQSRDVELGDLIQEGNLGLIKAVDRFDPSRGVKFSTYAVWWIRHRVGRSAADNRHPVRMPIHAAAAVRRLERASSALETREGRQPGKKEIERFSGLDNRTVERARNTPRPRRIAIISGDEPEKSDRDGAGVALVDIDAALPDSGATLSEWKGMLEEVLECLPAFEREIVRRRYGLDGEEESTLQAIGEDSGLSRERIRQLQNRALDRIRQQLRLD